MQSKAFVRSIKIIPTNFDSSRLWKQIGTFQKWNKLIFHDVFKDFGKGICILNLHTLYHISEGIFSVNVWCEFTTMTIFICVIKYISFQVISQTADLISLGVLAFVMPNIYICIWRDTVEEIFNIILIIYKYFL